MRRIPRIRQPARWLSSSSSTTRSRLFLLPQSQGTHYNNFTRSPSSTLGSTRYLSSTASIGDNQKLPSSLGSGQGSESTESNELVEDFDDFAPDPADLIDTSNYTLPNVPSRAEHYDGISDPSYVPASVADGLETVGGLDGWWDKPEHFKTRFAGFKPRSKVQDPAAIRAGVQRALTEALALRQAGRDSQMTAAWSIGVTDKSERQARVFKLKLSSNGTVEGDFQAVVKDLETFDEPSLDPEAPALTPISPGKLLLQADAQSGSDDASWEAISLADDRLKFAVSIKSPFYFLGQLLEYVVSNPPPLIGRQASVPAYRSPCP